MTARKILPRLLPLSLVVGLGTFAPACDDGKETPAAAKKEEPEKEEAKAAAADEPAPAEEKSAEAKAEDEKPAEPAAEEKPAEAKAEDETPAEPAAEVKPAEEKPAEPAKASKPKPKPKPKAEPKPKTDPKPEPAVAKADGKAIYMKKCKNCHGATGAADTKIAAKNDIESWKQPGWKGKWTVAKIKNIVTNGKSGTKMKSFKSKLTADEIDAVSAYSRSLGK